MENSRNGHTHGDHSEGTSAKRSRVAKSNSKKISEVQEMVTKLRSKHGIMFTPEQYHAWAQLIQMGKQTTYDEPPQYTFFKGVPKKSTSATLGSGAVSQATINSPGKCVHLQSYLLSLKNWKVSLNKVVWQGSNVIC